MTSRLGSLSRPATKGWNNLGYGWDPMKTPVIDRHYPGPINQSIPRDRMLQMRGCMPNSLKYQGSGLRYVRPTAKAANFWRNLPFCALSRRVLHV
jgi:hypothetical protein